MDDMTGAGWIALGTRGSGPRQFRRANGIFVDAGGRIYVVDELNHRVIRMDDMSGAGWTTLGKFGEGKGQFVLPGGIFIGP